MTVVGVVGDVKDQPNSPSAEPAFWWSEFQASEPDMSIAIRTRSDPRQVADGLRDAVHRLDPALAVADVKLMDTVVDYFGFDSALYLCARGPVCRARHLCWPPSERMA